jgi:predicted ATPase
MLSEERIIISGGPGFGKTTLILELEKSGFCCVHESSREIIQEQMSRGGALLPWIDLRGFSEVVFGRRLEQFFGPVSGPAFYDRGIPDIAAYLELAGMDLWPELEASCRQQRYHQTVFLTPPWPEIFRNDSERKESFELAVQIHEAIKKQYLKLGYHCAEVPLSDAPSRAAFVLEQLRKEPL